MLNLIIKGINKIKSEGFFAFLFSVSRRLSLYNYYQFLRESAAFKKIFKINDIQKRFEQIYNKKLWGNHESVSGAGSTMEATESFRKWLIENIPKLNVNKLVDAPCGDFHWMQHVTKAVSFEYFGFDIVTKLIKNNTKFYGTDKITFEVADICKDKFPNCDLLIVRDCLFHLSFFDISNFLANIYPVKYRYLITTNYKVKGNFYNADIITSDFRIISIFAHPFNFKEENVFDTVYERTKNGIDRELVVFEKKNVPTKLADWEGLDIHKH